MSKVYVIAKLIRQALMFGGGALVGMGLIKAEELQTLNTAVESTEALAPNISLWVGSIMEAVALIWSWVRKVIEWRKAK